MSEQVVDQVVEIIVIGLNGSGKSSLLKSISQQTTAENDWFIGRLAVDENLYVHFLEPPLGPQFDYLMIRDVIAQNDVEGFIVVMDSTQPARFGESVSILQTVRACHADTPVVVACTRPDGPDAWAAADIQLALGIEQHVPVLPVIATDFNSVREAVLQLLYKVFGSV